MNDDVFTKDGKTPQAVRSRTSSNLYLCKLLYIRVIVCFFYRGCVVLMRDIGRDCPGCYYSARINRMILQRRPA